jgi:hypothetical protein
MDANRKSEKDRMVTVQGSYMESKKTSMMAGIGAVFRYDQHGWIVYCASAEGDLDMKDRYLLHTFLDSTQSFPRLMLGVAGSSSHDAIERGLLQRGDVLLSIDGVDMRNRDMHDIAARLLGAEGTLVTVKFRRQTETGFIENTIAMDRRPMQYDAIRRVALSVAQ